MRFLLAPLLAAAVTTAALAAAAAPAASPRSIAAYQGAGSWVSIYDTGAWKRPQRVVLRLAAHGVSTLFLQTGNYRGSADVVRPAAVGRFLDAAHDAGIAVVAWYLPSLADPQRDLRRSLAAIHYRSPRGESFDSFALDLEATTVRSIPLRNARAVRLASSVRAAVAPDYPLGAITIAPVGSSPSFWRSYPFRRLAARVDVLLPMTYFTARTHGAAEVAAYTAANLRSIRDSAGRDIPIHPIGGESRRATLSELAAFFRVASPCSTVGTSLWEYGETTTPQWATLALAAQARAAAGGC